MGYRDEFLIIYKYELLKFRTKNQIAVIYPFLIVTGGYSNVGGFHCDTFLLHFYLFVGSSTKQMKHELVDPTPKRHLNANTRLYKFSDSIAIIQNVQSRWRRRFNTNLFQYDFLFGVTEVYRELNVKVLKMLRAETQSKKLVNFPNYSR